MFDRRQPVGASLTGAVLIGLTALALAAVAERPPVAHGQQRQIRPAAAVPTAGPGNACVGTRAFVAIPALGISSDLTSAIPLLSVDTAILNSTTVGSGSGGGAGKTTFDPLTFVTRPNPHTVDLFATLVAGRTIDEVDVLFVGGSGGGQTVCRTLTLQTVVVTKLEVQMESNSFGLSSPSDAVTLVYGSASIADGGKSAGWSVIANGPTS